MAHESNWVTFSVTFVVDRPPLTFPIYWHESALEEYGRSGYEIVATISPGVKSNVKHDDLQDVAVVTGVFNSDDSKTRQEFREAVERIIKQTVTDNFRSGAVSADWMFSGDIECSGSFSVTRHPGVMLMIKRNQS